MLRFIPVCTGNTGERSLADTLSTVYPCVYREHITRTLPAPLEAGLSLCVQGTLHLIGEPLPARRFIPVCTGNTHPADLQPSRTTVYPCVYREHINRASQYFNYLGLSLCVQGTHS